MITAKIVEPILGNKLYQERARMAFPLLVRQAEVESPITYSDLAKELSMPNPRNLNHVLGSIGFSLERLSEKWDEKIPSINSLVVNKNTRLPGEGIGWFLIKNDDFSALPTDKKRAIVTAEHQLVFSYPRWREILKLYDLKPINIDYSSVIAKSRTSGGGGGESECHKTLKEYIANNPQVIGLGADSRADKVEYPLCSMDRLDVSFNKNNVWLGVEVKSAISSESDIIRGLFQCVKYHAVMNAELILNGRKPNARTLLVLEGSLPQSLIPIKNILGIEVIEGVSPKVG